MHGFHRTVWAAAAVLATILSPAAAGQHFALESGPKRVALLELFTSEGCSSCPPADRWLSRLVDDTRLWKTIVPVAFHVDYWDYIGWEDHFARKKFGDRQHQYRRRGHIRSIYTPGFVVAGQEWREWFKSPVLRLPPAPSPGSLTVKGEDGKVFVRFSPTPSAQTEKPMVHVARLGFALSTEVKTGENHGRQLRHDFVVIGHAQRPMGFDGATLTAELQLPEVDVKAPREALAVWISHRDDPLPIQAVGGWL